LAEAMPVAPDGVLYVGMQLNQRRADGRLEPLFVKALATEQPPRAALDTANNLRGMEVSPAVEDAVVAAWRRRPPGPERGGLWPYVLGQIRPAPRESRVRAIFEMLATGDDSARQLTERVITAPVDESARAVAAQLAAAALATAKS